MTASENLRRELERTEARIEDLREVLYRVDSDLRYIRGRVSLLRMLRVRALEVGLERQIRNLQSRREVMRNCYAEAKRYEDWLQNHAHVEETRVAVGC